MAPASVLVRTIMVRIACVLVAAMLGAAPPANAQFVVATVPPGQLVLAGQPVVCGSSPTQIVRGLNDVAMNTGSAILLNEMLLSQVPVYQWYVYGHECAHFLYGPNEIAADQWSVCTGKHQGWFPPQAFQVLILYLQNNPGDFMHPSGPNRLQLMMQAYANC